MIVFAAAATCPLAEAASELECQPTSKFVCGTAGCSPVPIDTWATASLAAETYSRCDLRACDRHAAEITQSGVFSIVELPGRGTFAKLGPPLIDRITVKTREGYLAHFPADWSTEQIKADLRRRMSTGPLQNNLRPVREWVEVATAMTIVFVSVGYCWGGEP